MTSHALAGSVAGRYYKLPASPYPEEGLHSGISERCAFADNSSPSDRTMTRRLIAPEIAVVI